MITMCDLFVDFPSSHSWVLQVSGAAVGEANAAAHWEPADWKIHTVEPAGVVVNPTAAQLQPHSRNKPEQDAL